MKKNKQGFTLIELLAVIVIMGILMIIAIPMMTRYIENSRKDTFVSTAKAYINAARYGLLNDEYATCTIPDSSTSPAIIVPFNIINIEDGGGKSPFGNATFDTTNSIVVVTWNTTAGKPVYSVAARDTGNNGIAAPVTESALKRDDVKKGTVPATGITKPTGTTCTKS